jgi:cytochrome c oxidase subunit 1
MKLSRITTMRMITITSPASSRWFMSTNHKDIGTLYLIFAIFAGVVGGAISGMMRAELAHPGIQYLGWTRFVGGDGADLNQALHMWNVLITRTA